MTKTLSSWSKLTNFLTSTRLKSAPLFFKIGILKYLTIKMHVKSAAKSNNATIFVRKASGAEKISQKSQLIRSDQVLLNRFSYIGISDFITAN